MQEQKVRVNKYLSEVGYCSRRAADKLISEGRVTNNGIILNLGDKISPSDKLCIDNIPVEKQNKRLIIIYNKPRGIICTTTDRYGKNNVISSISIKDRVYPVGRLDKESEGLLILTNDGELTANILKAGNNHEKEYIVTVDRVLTSKFLHAMANGMYLKELDKYTAKCKITPIINKSEKETKRFKIILTQGLNRQIRRMCEQLNYKVTSLKRIRIMNLTLDGLKTGEFRYLSEKEYNKLLILSKAKKDWRKK